MLLLVVGIPALFAGGALWLVTRHADPDGAFAARFETVRTPGHAVVVSDLDRLLRQEAPFARTAQTRLRLDVRATDGPAFLGLAPTAEARRWLESVPHASVRRAVLAGVRCRSGWNRPARAPRPGRRAGHAAGATVLGTRGIGSWSGVRTTWPANR
ncbi:hypothetical protein NKG94_27415 [Micromonospora sp. M12]